MEELEKNLASRLAHKRSLRLSPARVTGNKGASSRWMQAIESKKKEEAAHNVRLSIDVCSYVAM